MSLSGFQRRTYEIVEKASPDDRVSRWFDVVVMLLVCLNAAGVVLETVPALAQRHAVHFQRFEEVCVAFFTVELGLRLFCAGADPRYAGVRGRLRFLRTPLVIIDMIAVLPFLLTWTSEVDTGVVLSLRLFRLLRLLKMGRYLESLQMLGRVARDRRDQLLGALLVVGILLVVSASMMYTVENEAQPQVFSSIPMAMWWAVATLTTVGYGDIYPVTAVGRVLGAVMALLGVGVIAIPAGIIGSGFAEELARKREARMAEERICPHCGGDLDGAVKEEEAEEREAS